MDPAAPRQPFIPPVPKSPPPPPPPKNPQESDKASEVAQDALKNISISAPSDFRKGVTSDEMKKIKQEALKERERKKLELEEDFVEIEKRDLIHEGKSYSMVDLLSPLLFTLQTHPKLKETEGVFRLSGVPNDRKELIETLLKNRGEEIPALSPTSEKLASVKTLTDTLKTFFSELSPRLLEKEGENTFEKIDEILQKPDPESKLKALINYLNSLSKEQKIILLKLLTVTDTIIANKDNTKMTAVNLGVTPGPALLPVPKINQNDDPMKAAKMFGQINSFATLIFENSAQIQREIQF